MSLANCNYSIVKVSGLSMNPFFKSDDILLINQSNCITQNQIGYCFLIDDKIHRQVEPMIFKGDRLLYNDILKSKPVAVVIGKIIQRKSKKYLTNHEHLLLKKISLLIAHFSKLNIEQNKFRPLVLVSIISLSYCHRFFELFTLKEFKS